MAAYSGSVTLISGITQKNNGTFPLVNAPAVQVDDTGKRLDAKLAELEGSISNIDTDISVITDEQIDALFD